MIVRKFLSIFSIFVFLLTSGHLGTLCSEWMQGNSSVVHVLDQSVDRGGDSEHTAWLEVDACADLEMDDDEVVHEMHGIQFESRDFTLSVLEAFSLPEPVFGILVPPIELTA